MCGIIGISSPNNSRYIEVSNSIMTHRGPDDSGVYIGDNIALGHRRLSIQDLSVNGHQPMISQDGNFILVFNGEIYNHQEIRASLKGTYSFKSTSDTETLLYAFIEEGVDVFERLNGIFAFAILDIAKQEVVLCRDHFGIKPLYYYQKENEFYFASELKSFLPIPNWDKSIDYSALVNYLHFLWSPGEQTPFKFVKKVLPGHYAKIMLENPAKFSLTRYYTIPFDGTVDNLSEEEYISKVDVAFTKAVERQLLSDVPVGYFLSGGLDSSLIVAKVKQLTNEKVKCYTIDTDLDENDKEGFSNDLAYAKKVANYLDVDLNIVNAKVDIVKDFDKMIWHLDEPQADAAPLNVLNICQEARANGSIVLMGGAGGDDLFSGYRRHQAVRYETIFKMIPKSVGSLLKKGVSLIPGNNAIGRRIRKITQDIDKSQMDRLLGYFRWIPLEVNKSLFSKEIYPKIKDYNPSNILEKELDTVPNEKEPLNKLLFLDMKFFLTDHNLNYTDKLGMAAGVEARVPYLDKDLVELSTRIPVSLKLKGNVAKYILKKVAEKYLPMDVIYRPKTGFGAPVRKWITEDMDAMIKDFLAPDKIAKRGIFDADSVWKLIEDNKKGKIDASYTIWSLLAIESWMQQFVDSKT